MILTKYQNIMFNLEGAFSKEKSMPTKTRELKNPNNIHEIYQNIIADFDFDYHDAVKLYYQANTEQSKKIYLDYLKNEYKRLAEWSANEYQIADKYVKDVFQTAFGFSDQKITRIFSDSNNANSLKLWGWICRISIMICFTCFIAVLILLAANYI